ncbi:hypothetical protein SAMN02746073_1865 [Legionella jamestowniensis DSM 19215]|uniref:Uncharacterized protein n=1 Tax=Legionella jamestowniensis TaxID=455 RepID=A0A0W0V0M9_9GAMM|nr:hypothetical protein Ljam_0063 [Legionella jamestowniensis]SFL77801.1 hypothetical protein SAMN02746073_1865 [Legionella jamestowniensis DSM 19215]
MQNIKNFKKLHNLVHDLAHFEIYLKGGDTSELKRYLQYYDKRLDELKINYHQTVINTIPVVENNVKNLLKNLKIPSYQWKEYLNLTVYNFLLKLHRESHPQIAYLLKLLDEKQPPSQFRIFLGIGVGIAFMSLIASPQMQGVLLSLEALLTSVIGLPILGLIYNLSSTFYFVYQTQTDAKKDLFSRLYDNFFLLANTLINIMAYSFWIAAATPMTPLVAGLFVGASIVNVVKEVASLVQEYVKFQNLPAIQNPSDLLAHQTYLRQTHGFNKHRNVLLINLATSVLLVGVMAAWCFIPGGLMVTLGALTGIGILYGLKHFALKQNDKRTRNALQKQLKAVEKEYDRIQLAELSPVSPALSQLTPQLNLENTIIPEINELPPNQIPRKIEEALEEDSLLMPLCP